MRRLRVVDPSKGRTLGSWLCMLAYQRAIDYVRQFKKIPKHISIDALMEHEARDLEDIADDDLRMALRHDPLATHHEALATIDGSEHPLAARVVACGRKVGA